MSPIYKLSDPADVAHYEPGPSMCQCTRCGAWSEGDVLLCGCPAPGPLSRETLTVVAVDWERGIVTFG